PPVVTAAPHPIEPEHHVAPPVHHGGHGAAHAVGVPGVPKEFEKRSLPVYVVEPPDILLIRASPSATAPVQAPLDGQHLVRPDGSINLGVYGDVWVAGMTLEEVRDAVAAQILRRTKNPDLTVEKIKLELQVDVLAYNSKVYYVITDGGGYGEQVYRIPVK